jgi:hypothetical protein
MKKLLARFDGAPVGEDAITISNPKGKSLVSEGLTVAATTTLRVSIRENENSMRLDLP